MAMVVSQRGFIKVTVCDSIFILKFGKLPTKIILRNCYYKNALSLQRKAKQAKLCLQDRNKMINYGAILGPGAVTR